MDSATAAINERILGLERRWWIVVTLGIGGLVMALDASVVNTVLPVIRDSFGTDMSSIEWVLMAYLLTVIVLLLSFGRVGDMMGHKQVFVLGLVVFTLASLLCGLSPNAPFLIGFRALQGVGYAMVGANIPAIVTRNWPAAQRGRALGLQVTVAQIGIIIGPSFGGFIADHAGWRYIFFIKLPVGVLATAMAAFFIPRSISKGKRETFDVAGASTLMVGLGALTLGLSKGQEAGWASPPILGLFAVAVVFLVLFLRLEKVVQCPMLDLSLLRSRLFSAATTSSLINYLCLYATMFLMPFYLVQGRGFSPGSAGLLLTAQAVAMAVMTPIAGLLSDRIGSRLPATGGMALMAVGLAVFGTLDVGSSAWHIALPLVLTGIANGSFGTPNNIAIMGSVPSHQQGVAAAITATARTMGMILGVAVSGAIFATQLYQPGDALLGSQPDAFFSAFQFTFFVIAGLALLGAMTSAVRGSGKVAASRSITVAP